MRFWEVDIEGHGRYLYIDRVGNTSESRLRIVIYRMLFNDLFERPEMQLRFIPTNERLHLTAGNLRRILHSHLNLIQIKLPSKEHKHITVSE